VEEKFISSIVLPSNTPVLLQNTLALFENKWHLLLVKMVLMEDMWKRKSSLP
jgi:ABC-type glycerol-3-phosphate transport system permease component